MKQFRLAICDDETFFIEDIRQYLKAYESESGYEIITTAYSSGSDLINAIKSGEPEYDFYFLDVEMPEMKGTDVAKHIRRFCPQAVICFITSFEEYAYEAYQSQALGYLKKPVSYVDLKHMMNRCTLQVQYLKDAKEAQQQYLEVKTGRGSKVIRIDDILYIEKRRNQCVFHLEDGEFVCYNTLSNIYKQLDKTIFFYVHQGYIVSFPQVREVKSNVVCLGKDREIPLSRKYQPKIHNMYMEEIRVLCQEHSI